MSDQTADVDALVALGDSDVAVELQQTDDAAGVSFEQFYRQEMAALVRFVRRYGASPYAAADAVHEAFAEAYPKWDSIKAPRAWLRLVAARFYYRRKLRETPVDDVPDRPAIYEDVIEIGEQGRRVFDALAALPERQRQVMAWHLDGYSHAEIAELLSITAAAVRQNFYRARQALKLTFGLSQAEEGRDQ